MLNASIRDSQRPRSLEPAKILRSLVVAAVIAALATQAAYADEMSGRVEGRIAGPTGAPAKDIRVALSGPQGFLVTNTDAQGRFWFLSVPPGQYTVYDGGYCVARPIIDVDAGITWRLGTILFVPLPRQISHVCPRFQPNYVHQLMGAGTTADVYIIRT